MDVRTEEKTGLNGSLTQTIVLSAGASSGLTVRGTILAPGLALAAETDRPATGFRFIRNEVGRSSNRLNNGVYDRLHDWVLSGPSGSTSITPGKEGEWRFAVEGSGPLTLTFRPAFYRVHKNIRYFQPWEHQPWKGSITGWCSWWAYKTDISAADVDQISDVFARNLKDWGYRYIQIDDGYEAGLSGTLHDWLTTTDRFPGGLVGLADSIRRRGLDPAIWVNVHFDDPKTLAEHPDWFIQDSPGHPHKGPWIDYALNPASKGAEETLIRPHYKALRDQGWDYVKIDTLRHFLYDSMYPSRSELQRQGQTPEHLLRLYMKTAREELGPKTYILACWGVLPEVVGYADGSRLGTDGYGPATLQQYSSWNNIVWRNDPDHCDLEPIGKDGKPETGQERIRATLASVAGAQLLLSDHPEVYEKPAALEAARRVSPVLFTLPGQLYDFDPRKTDALINGLRNQNGGSDPGPIDADQFGDVCPWWALDISTPFEKWMVLTEMNWEKAALPAQKISFRELGLDPSAEYLVFEGWSGHLLGAFKGSFTAPALAPNGAASFAIRRLLPRPQLVSTNRHISQGAVEIKSMRWNAQALTLSGSANLVPDPKGCMYFHIPAGFELVQAEAAGVKARTQTLSGHILRLDVGSTKPKSATWKLQFRKG